MLLQAEPLAHCAFDVITAVCSFGDFLGDNQPQPGVPQRIGSHIQLKKGVAACKPVIKHTDKISRFQQPLRAAKAQSQALYSQTLAAFGAARSQYGAAATGFGTHQKAMGALTAGNGRLVSTFHLINPALKSGKKQNTRLHK